MTSQTENTVVVKDLTIKFGEFTAVNNISFNVQRGEIFGFLGANGAGKTTTIRMLCGLLEPSHGEVEIAGFDYKDGADRIKSKVGYMSQKFTLYTDLTVDENLWFASQLRKLDPAYTKKRIKELFEFIEFNQPVTSLVRDLPGGLKQELSLVASMLHEPDIIFLDEPTAGVSPSARNRFWALINKLSIAGKTVFVTTHYMDEAEQCHRIALMRAGEIIALDTPEALKTKSFTDLLVEIEPHSRKELEWVEELRKQPGILGVVPYGLRYHAVMNSSETFRRAQSTWANNGSMKLIKPSLEDVFIRLVEGVNR